MSRKRIPLNQNGCTANFRIGVPFGQNLHTALVGFVLGIKNKETMKVFWNTLKNNDPKIPIKTENPRITEQVSSIESVVIPMHREYKEPFDVSYHIRKLHEGWKASPEKLAKAADYGIELLPGQTLVEGYTKGKVA